MNVIFLDIDGVLNGHDWDDKAQSCYIRPCCVDQLNRITDATGARLVISSAWRYMIHGGMITVTGFWYLLRTHRVRARVIGLTCKDEELPLRGDQIAKWLEDHKHVTNYVVLDDECVEMTRFPDRVVLTDGAKGLTERDADRAIAILKAGEKQETRYV